MARYLRTSEPSPPEFALPQLRQVLLVFLLLALPGLTGCAAEGAAQAVAQAAPTPADQAEFEEIRAAAKQLIAGAKGQAGHPMEGKRYTGPFVHGAGPGCAVCHEHAADAADGTGPETWTPSRATCRPCHAQASNPDAIRTTHSADYDGDGDATEPLASELDALLADLMTAIQSSSRTTGSAICYHPERYPYWMKDTDSDGVCGDDEAGASNAYEIWTEPMLRASCNYQVVSRQRGAWAHNFDYAAQLIIDSIEVLGADVTRYARPE